MARNEDDDLLTGPVPLPDDEPTAMELAHAKTFASLVDKALAGRSPAAMSTDDRALLEVATVIRATSGGLELAAARRSALVEDALRQAIGGVPSATNLAAVVTTPVVPIGGRRRWLPWSIAATSTVVAAAAIVALWVRAPKAPAVVPAATTAALPASWTSRPSDSLIGPIAREHAGDATARIDEIFADRLDGFRERTYTRGGRR
jgi:hypothetical protein